MTIRLGSVQKMRENLFQQLSHGGGGGGQLTKKTFFHFSFLATFSEMATFHLHSKVWPKFMRIFRGQNGY